MTLFLRHIFIKHLLCSGYSPRFWEFRGIKAKALIPAGKTDKPRTSVHPSVGQRALEERGAGRWAEAEHRPRVAREGEM